MNPNDLSSRLHCPYHIQCSEVLGFYLFSWVFDPLLPISKSLMDSHPWFSASVCALVAGGAVQGPHQCTAFFLEWRLFGLQLISVLSAAALDVVALFEGACMFWSCLIFFRFSSQLAILFCCPPGAKSFLFWSDALARLLQACVQASHARPPLLLNSSSLSGLLTVLFFRVPRRVGSGCHSRKVFTNRWELISTRCSRAMPVLSITM